ncbi:hypothetical protein HDV00_008803 [Rhizophlyctis rosea]|nr:hypothetical protein HDV00_008803 [Rhizophlyctis rosea]
MSSLTTLPQELLHKIFSYVPAPDLPTVRSTSRTLRAATYSYLSHLLTTTTLLHLTLSFTANYQPFPNEPHERLPDIRWRRIHNAYLETKLIATFLKDVFPNPAQSPLIFEIPKNRNLSAVTRQEATDNFISNFSDHIAGTEILLSRDPSPWGKYKNWVVLETSFNDRWKLANGLHWQLYHIFTSTNKRDNTTIPFKCGNHFTPFGLGIDSLNLKLKWTLPDFTAPATKQPCFHSPQPETITLLTKSITFQQEYRADTVIEDNGEGYSLGYKVQKNVGHVGDNSDRVSEVSITSVEVEVSLLVKALLALYARNSQEFRKGVE